MNKPATPKQKQFLRRLGHKEVANLSKAQASGLIDRLLEQECQSGKQFPCPYCKQKFGPRPKRTKKCPHCGNTIYHVTGQFLAEERIRELRQKEWLKDERAMVKDDVREDWREEQKYRREFREPDTVGYLINIGPNCSRMAHLNGTIVMLEDAKEHPEMLPPYDECQHETCQCRYQSVSSGQVPRGTRVAELVAGRRRQPRKQKNAGCAAVVLVVLAGMAVGWQFLA